MPTVRSPRGEDLTARRSLASHEGAVTSPIATGPTKEYRIGSYRSATPYLASSYAEPTQLPCWADRDIGPGALTADHARDGAASRGTPPDRFAGGGRRDQRRLYGIGRDRRSAARPGGRPPRADPRARERGPDHHGPAVRRRSPHTGRSAVGRAAACRRD